MLLRNALAATAAILLAAVHPAAATEPARPPVPLDQEVKGEIVWEEQSWRTFRVDVPRDAMVLRLQVKNAPVDLDLFARHREPMESYEADAEHSASSLAFNDELVITRLSEPPLKPGTYYVDVAYTVAAEPRQAKQRLRKIPFIFTASVIRDRVDGQLLPEVGFTTETGKGTGWFRSFVVQVPVGAEALRVDLDGAAGDLDIRARRSRSILAPEDAELNADSVLGRETLLIDSTSEPSLVPGIWYVQVQDPYELDVVPFTAYLSFSKEPPQALLELPDLSRPTDGAARALASTVELSTLSGAGSGTLVSPEGWVLTNYHVVEARAGGPVGDSGVVVSASQDFRRPPRELFRGRVVEADETLDLALVKIEGGLYGQPLPEGYRFPYLELGDSRRLMIGDPLAVLGFPGVGGMGSRVSVTLTQGVVAGFELTEAGSLIKTDAEISSGNSGGAAVDPSWRLVGIPVATVEDSSSSAHLGYVIPVELLPTEWLRYLIPGE